MSDYQVIARKFRPQSFKDVIGQEAIVTTLKNAMKSKRLAQAYLFCGSRGTGKTTLARLLAKALNCQQPTTDSEPCNQCSSCREMMAGSSLDIIEIDGASHRGIEDIRQINETVGYASSGHFKIYIIDEVHMLTKEAFNALLKTLEEPPPKVKFFFATTEPHKVPATVLSRCQRFNLNRISQPLIITKLAHIAKQLSVEVEEEALRLVAQRAEGGLRDAESLFDQILSFEEGRITAQTVGAILGLMPRDIYFEIDYAGKEGNFIKAFEIAHQVFTEGKDLTFFIEGLIDHLRQILLVKVSGIDSSFMTLTPGEKEKYFHAASLYSREQCLDLIEYLIEAQNQLRTTPFGKVSLETILLHVMRSHFRLSIEQLVRHMSELEQRVNEKEESDASAASASIPKQVPETTTLHSVSLSSEPSSQPLPTNPTLPEKIVTAPLPIAQVIQNPPSTKKSPESLTTEDPTPSPADLGKRQKEIKKPLIQPSPTASQSTSSSTLITTPIIPPTTSLSKPTPIPAPTTPPKQELQRSMHAYDTLMHFAAVELEGKLQKN